jgi:rod shape-determining protein MreD
MKKEITFIFILLFLIFVETSFPPIFSFPLNLVLIFLFFSSFFLQKKFAILFASITGFFLDIFSEKFFGFYFLISILIFILVNFLIKRYVKI